ncbi:phosphoglucomutase 2 [Rhynchophorus ferrugineus]|uniref:phosphoglucomutase 2 n=1 Tax=Rhynchophorus ferrugineus TaxID=354439 RepID=UPI003FCE6154
MSSKCGLSEDVKAKIDEWLSWDKNKTTRDCIKRLAEENSVKDLQNILLKRLDFGTAGLRGKMAAGYACMNDLVIIQTAQGFLRYLEQHRSDLLKAEGVTVGYDGRHNSKRWAELTATVFANAGYKIRLFGDYNITPFIPFAVRKYGCASGVMVTASHNPKDDNGYKVYDSNGAQIVSPVDKRIQESILKNLEPWETSWNTEILKNNDLVVDPMSEVLDCYLKTIISDAIHPDLVAKNRKAAVPFTYTPLHGVGYMPVEKVAQVIGINLSCVPEQKDPHPDFPTVKFPNPEEGKSSLDLAFKHAETNGSTVILANDPDADRFAVAEKNKHTGEWKIFTGNELGTLFGWWILTCYRKNHPDRPLNKVYMIASTVSSMILKTMSKMEGFNFVDTLTGFKWIGNKALELEKDGYDVIFCFEEAIGYMCNNQIVDKDGVSALAHFAGLVSLLYDEGKQIVDKLAELYDTYGFHVSLNSYYFCYDPEKIRTIFGRIRNYGGTNQYPSGILNDKYKVVSIRDLTTGYDNSQSDNRAVLPVSCKLEMITFIYDNGLHVTLRTSGTEPKIKYYTELCTSPDIKDKTVVESTLREMVTAICEEYFQPEINGLIPQKA